jgi:hypothetical protein
MNEPQKLSNSDKAVIAVLIMAGLILAMAGLWFLAEMGSFEGGGR